ncbi:MAG: WD40 repeat domain-containing protein [Candidatus Hermodarchaeota archaeon]
MINKRITLVLILFSILLLPVSIFIVPENGNFKLDNKDDYHNQQLVPFTSNTIVEKWNFTTSQDVNHLAISDDGKYVCAVIGNNITLFNNDNNNTLLNYEMNSPITSMDLSSKGDYIAVGDENGNVTLFNCTSFDDKVLEWSYKTDDFIKSVAISPDGKYIVAGDKYSLKSEGYIYFFNNSNTDPKNYEWRYDILSEITSIDIGYDKTDDIYYIVAGNDYSNGMVYYFNNTNEDLKKEMWIYETVGPVNEVDMSLDGNYFTVHCSENDNLYTFNKSSSESQPPMGFFHGVRKDDLAISPEGGYITVGNVQEDMTYLFDNLLNEPIWKAESGNSVNSVDISLYGNYILAGSVDNHMYLYHKSSNNSIWSYDSGAEVRLVALSLTGNYIAGVSSDGSNINTIYLFYHDIPNPLGNPELSDNGDSSNNSESNNAIPFGNYHLLFISIGIIGLIVINKRKTLKIN